MILLCRITLAIFLLLGCCLTYAEEANPITHSVFIAGPNFTGIIGEDGKPTWTAPQKKARDGYVLDNGHVLIAWAKEVKEFDKEKKV